MSLAALALVLVAAVCHATWNLLAKRAGGGAPFVWLFTALGVALYAPLALAVYLWQRPALGLAQLGFIVGSAVLHLAYFLLLQRGYRVGDLSLIYPLARGTGPALSTAAAIMVFGERPTPLALVGAGLVVVSIFGLTLGQRQRSGVAVGGALAYGLLTGLLIAIYTLWDKRAVSDLLIPPLLLDWGAGLGRTLLLLPVALRHWPTVTAEWQQHRREVLGVAALSPLAYILVLTALAMAPVSAVAPAREISILIGAIFGTHLLAEGQTRRRLPAAVAMVAGVLVLALA